MNTVATAPETRKATRKPRCKERFCNIHREAGGDFLTIREVFARKPDVFDVYKAEAFLSEMGGRGIELTKPDGTRYHVNLNGKASTCSCPGFESHGWHIDRATGELVACKHIMALLSLEQAGKL
jgi:SWIM zinc finger